MTFLLLAPPNKSGVHTGRPGLHPLPPGDTTTLGHSTAGWGEEGEVGALAGEGMKGLVVVVGEGRKGFSLPVGLAGERGGLCWCAVG